MTRMSWPEVIGRRLARHHLLDPRLAAWSTWLPTSAALMRKSAPAPS